ncbi:peroxisome biogenesis protein 6 [Selaginella moellendorffii]|uniref:peroxisome biogenesis protein 6 n=1 Tax=Selaginella moellendorffii TaxID=88036 RepID=UPI000D1C795D|nr:peroxisome biogenesis protein 6 [Selaginella moellendorffii]|eukprot:XP_024540800.1 peroxisome biogenesis protein 6 [Selaginella moellendorffii]
MVQLLRSLATGGNILGFIAMPGRRRALVLRKTSAAVSALVNGDFDHCACAGVDLSAGILFVDDSEGDFVLGVASSVLRELSISSGSWVLVRNAERNVSRAAKVLVLDPPLSNPVSSEPSSPPSPAPRNFFPSCRVSPPSPCVFDSLVGYVSPLLAFNLGIHLAWLETIVTARNSESSPYAFDKTASVLLRVEALDDTQIKVASHMRVSYVKIPVLSSSLDNTPRNRQEEVDAALKLYFSGGKCMATGDLFSVKLPSSTITDFYQRFHYGMESEDTVLFKVLSLEPSTEPFLRIDQNHTALVLSGSIPSSLPPLVLKQKSSWCSSLHAPAVRELVSLAAPCFHPNLSPLRISTLILGPAGVGKRTVARLVADALGIHVVEYNCYELVGASEGKTALALEHVFKVASRYSPVILLLRRFGALGEKSGGSPNQSQGPSRVAALLKSCITKYGYSRQPVEDVTSENSENVDAYNVNEDSDTALKNVTSSVLLIATAEDEASVKSLRHCFTHEISINTPDEAQRLELLQHFLGCTELTDELLLGAKSISSQTAGLVPRDLKAVAADIAAFTVGPCDDENSKILSSSRDHCKHFSPECFEKALEQVKKRTASAIGTPKVPNVKWEDIGGLENVKRAILDTVQVPLVHRELFTSGLRQRSGVMLYGPPGTGKTLLAKAVATECSLNFLSVKGPEVINMFIGESEKNVRELFQKARGARPCVIFFDELDALAPARGASGDSGGVMDRVVSQLLAEIDGLGENTQDLFVIGATNRPDLIDSALLRPGRFDKLLYVGISPDPTYREKVLSALSRKFDLDKDVSLGLLARKCPDNFTGADMYALCADAWMQAVKRKALSFIEEDDSTVVVKQEDFFQALAELKPSLSLQELAKYERLRVQLQGT